MYLWYESLVVAWVLGDTSVVDSELCYVCEYVSDAGICAEESAVVWPSVSKAYEVLSTAVDFSGGKCSSDSGAYAGV